MDLVDTGLFQPADPQLVEQGAGFNQYFVGARTQQIRGNHTTQHTLAQGLNHVAAFNQRSHDQAFFGAAIDLGNHQILCHIDQATGQVTRVSRLQRGISQTLTSTVSRDEVLQNIQTFAEVRSNRGLDDRAIGLGHQASHTGKLTNLGSRASSAGVSHHVDGVKRLLLNHFAFCISHHFGAEHIHHGLGHLLVGTRPDIHNLVVALTVGHQTRGILVLDFLNFTLRTFQNLALLFRHNHVVGSDRSTCAGSVTETRVHQLVSKHHGLFQTNPAVAFVHYVRNGLLAHRVINKLERQTLRQNLGQQCTTGGSADQTGAFMHFTRFIQHALLHTYLDPGLKMQAPALVRTVHFGHVSEQHAFALGVNTLASHVVQTQHHVL